MTKHVSRQTLFQGLCHGINACSGYNGISLDHADLLYTMIGIIDCYTYKHKLMCNLANIYV